MRRGEVWMTDFGPPDGPEQAGVRPAVVLQDDELNATQVTTILVPITSKLRRIAIPTTVLLQAGEGGLPRTRSPCVTRYKCAARPACCRFRGTSRRNAGPKSRMG